jgi:aminoglycoside 3-N-acetyltransferase
MLSIDDLVTSFTGLGVRRGGTVLVHASLSRLGFVCGGPVAVVEALLDVLGPAGTVVVPTQTVANSDPSRWTHNGTGDIPPRWWPKARDTFPPFDPERTPSRGMGVVAECVRTWPGARRSAHPVTSFAALGARAAEIVATHPTHCRLGESSPLGALDRLGASVLLLGVGFDKCTAFHLAEYRRPARMAQFSCAVKTASAGRRWETYTDVDLDATDFAALGAAFDPTGMVTSATVGQGLARHFRLDSAVSFALQWMDTHRSRGGLSPMLPDLAGYVD